MKTGPAHNAPDLLSLSKTLFDKLSKHFQNVYKSSENAVIENERHPRWVSFVTIFLSEGGGTPAFLTDGTGPAHKAPDLLLL